MTTETERVLVVDDEIAILDIHSAWLAEDYSVDLAASGEEALETIGPEIGAVILDRHMPGLSGETTLVRMREQGYRGGVAFFSGVDPGTDLVDLPLDLYLQKPASKEEVLTTVESLLLRNSFDPQIRELFALAAKKRAIQQSNYEAHQSSADYQALLKRLADCKARIGDSLDRVIEEHDPERLFSSVNPEDIHD